MMYHTKILFREPSKKCSECGELFPANISFFHKRKLNKDGLNGKCKCCVNKYNRDRHNQLMKENNEYRNKKRQTSRRNIDKAKSKYKWAKWYAKNKYKYRENRRIQYSDDTMKEVIRSKMYRDSNKHIITDAYALKLIINNSNLSKKDIPLQLIENKKLILELKRELKHI